MPDRFTNAVIAQAMQRLHQRLSDFDCPPDEMLEKMHPGKWVTFGEYDNISGLLDLIGRGDVEIDPSYDNIYSSMITSIRARRTE